MSPRLETCVVLAGCLLFVLLASVPAYRQSATFDEPVHLAAGWSYLSAGDFRMNPEHPPLLKEWAALPLLAMAVWPRDMDVGSGADGKPSTSLAVLRRAWAMGLAMPAAESAFARNFLYGVKDSVLARYGASDPQYLPTTVAFTRDDFHNDADRLLFAARVQMILVGTLLAFLIHAWSRDLHGGAGAAISLCLFIFNPEFLGHSGVVATDVGLSACFFGAIYFLWRACRRLDFGAAAGTAFFVGLSAASKFSAVLLLPIFTTLGLARCISSEPWPVFGENRLRAAQKALVMAVLGAACVCVAWVMVWAAYGFRYDAARDPSRAAVTQREAGGPSAVEARLPIEAALALGASLGAHPGSTESEALERLLRDPGSVRLGAGARLLRFAARRRLLPEAYLFGLASASLRSLDRGAFLFGRLSTSGWWYYFPAAMLVKTPLVALLAIVAALGLAGKKAWAGEERLRLAFLLVPAAVLLAAAMSAKLNIGHRHILPAYPFLFVLCGNLAGWRPRISRRSRQVLGALGLAAVAAGAFVVWSPPWRPAFVGSHYLAYFNELAGGPRNGFRVLADSNVDWGQDLPALKTWLEARHIREPIQLCYFGMADPRFYGIPFINMPGGSLLAPQTEFPREIHGYVAISATQLAGPYFDSRLRESWRTLLSRAELVGNLGYSIYVYRL